MAQLVQPLTRIGSKTARADRPALDNRRTPHDLVIRSVTPWEKAMPVALELLLQKVMKTLLATLQILKTASASNPSERGWEASTPGTATVDRWSVPAQLLR